MSRPPKAPGEEAGEELLATGRFRVDRKRALEKMEKFQLADPLAYTVELVAAAVVAGATRIEVRNDSDDFELRWDGDGPTRDELDALFDHLFSDDRDPRASLLRHLALGVLGALGQDPRWVHVDRGGAPALRLSVRDPSETRAEEHPHDEPGTRIHVRQRFSLANVAEALLAPVKGLPEARLLRARARWCPVPLLLDGVALAAPAYPDALATVGPPGRLVLVRDTAARVDIVRHGVTVAEVARVVGPFAVAGWFPGDAVGLDASRANVVTDGRWEAVTRALDAAVVNLLHAAGAALAADLADDATIPSVERADERAAATWRARVLAVWLARAEQPLGPLADIPLLADVTGRVWTVAALAAHPDEKGTITDASLADPGAATVLFVRAGEDDALDALAPGLPDLSAALRTRAEGRARRARAAAEREPPEFPRGAYQRRFTDGQLRGAVRFQPGDEPTLRLTFRIDGVSVEEAHLPSPALAMAAIVDHPGFTTDDAFRAVLPDATRAAAEARARAEATTFAAEHVARVAAGKAPYPDPDPDPYPDPDPVDVVTAAVRAAGGKARANLLAILAARPDDALLRAAAFPVGDGRRIALPELLDGTWILATSLPPACPPTLAARVLLLPDAVVPTWMGWLGTRARDGRGSLADEVRGEARRAGRKYPATLDVGGVKTPIGGGRAGEMAIRGHADDARIQVLRAGVPVCVLTERLGLPGIVAIVDDPTFDVNAAHDGFATDETRVRLLRELAPAVDALARARIDAAEVVPEAVLPWFAARNLTLPEWALKRPLAVRADGPPLTVATLRAWTKERRAARYKLLTRPPGDIPGFEDAYVVTPALRRALEALGGRAVRDADPDLADAARLLTAYRARPAAETPRALATLDDADEGITCRWIVPAEADRAGVLRVEARWGGRVLATWERGESLGLVGILEGPAIQPNAALTMLRDPNVLTPWYRRARTRFVDALAPALDAALDTPPAPADRATWRALLARLDAASERTGAETRLRDRLATAPLFVRLDGACLSRDAIAAALTTNAVHTLPADHPLGPTDSPWYFPEAPFVTRALGALAPRIPDGRAALDAWRAGEARRNTLAQRDARLTEDTLARRPLAREPDLTGEIGLVRASEHHPSGLRVTPLVDGRPLDTLEVPFPGPAVAVVTGPGVRPDRAFRAWAPDAAHRDALVAAADALAASLAASTVSAPSAADATPRAEHHRWLAAYALASAEGPGAELPVFPQLGGGKATARAVRAAHARGGVGVLAPHDEGPPFVAGFPPLLAPIWLRTLLTDAGLVVEDLTLVHARHRNVRPPAAPPHAVDVPGGRVAWSARLDAVDIVRGGVVLATVPAEGLVPLVGYVHVDLVDVDPLWKGLLPGPARDALSARLAAAAEVVLDGLLDDAERCFAPDAPPLPDDARTALIRALRTVVGAARDEGVLRARARTDVRVDRLLAAPLFRDCTGSLGSFTDVTARPDVRCVAPGVRGQPLPSRGRVWAFTVEERPLFARLRAVVDATEALRVETLGVARRAAAAGPPPAPPAGVPTARLDAPLQGALWLLPGFEADLDVRVGGAHVHTVPTPLPGLAGWVDGPFATDDGFTTARLDAAAVAAIGAVAARMLTAEVATDLSRVHGRLARALSAFDHDHDALLSAPMSPWAGVPLLRDTAGEPLDLRGLLRQRKSAKRFLVGPAGATPPRRGERVVQGGEAELAALRAWFPQSPVEDISEAEARRAEKQRADDEKRAESTRGRREAVFAERARRIWQKWCGTGAPTDVIERSVARWAADGRPGWPPILEAEPDGPWAALLAFAAGSPEGTDPDGIVAMRRVEGLAAALAERR